MIEKFLGASAVAQQSQKQMLMFETNTASCGGFPGSSNSFGSALWGVDYGLQLAYSNFSHALLHCGGQDVFYNVSGFLDLGRRVEINVLFNSLLLVRILVLFRFC